MRTTLIFLSLVLLNELNAQITGTVMSSSMSNCADGSIMISVSGGYPPYTYIWTGPDNYNSNQKNISNLKPGLYKLEVRVHSVAKHILVLR